MKKRLNVLVMSSLAILLSVNATMARASDPLPTWNEGDVKESIVAFVKKVSDKGSPDYVEPSERIAVFDNDGTLWCEAPLPFQAAFAFDEVKRRAPNEPSFAADPMVQAALAGRIDELLQGKHHDGLIQVLGLTHAGMTTDDFRERVNRWTETASHPRFQCRYLELTYQPMQELLDYLRDNQFECFIVSGGGADFMRVWSERVYGIVPQNVVGSMAQPRFENRDGVPVLVKTMDNLFVDDKEGKPVGIHQFIGRRPIACFGNSDGDQAMLEYTTIGNPNPSFGLIVHHTDAEREYAYDAKPPASGKLTTALEVAPQHGWTVVDMKRDWNRMWFDLSERVSSSKPQTLFGNWLAEDIMGNGVIDRAQTTLEVTADGSVSGSTAVNRYRGQATIDGNAITFGPLISTRRAGPPAMMNQESRFTEALSQVTGYRIDSDGLLYLTDGDGNDILRFSRLAD
ncbi:META domain-containing protein [Rhodopirellula sallentina]|uniref:META domain-containing protein n=1 Tax=Rhodopirellula sallentina TaxID=1263869 RepID=UPI001F15DBDB|nr:META domain-containing protein [Rhodopirellula sallentina]